MRKRAAPRCRWPGRWTRRAVALLVGLALGWYAAGQWHEARWASAADRAMDELVAAEAAQPGGAVEDAGPAAGAAEPAGSTAAEAPGEDTDQPQSKSPPLADHPATALLPRRDGEATTPPWLTYIAAGIAGLFATALLVGLIVRKAGYRDPGAVATEQDRQAHHH